MSEGSDLYFARLIVGRHHLKLVLWFGLTWSKLRASIFLKLFMSLLPLYQTLRLLLSGAHGIIKQFVDLRFFFKKKKLITKFRKSQL